MPRCEEAASVSGVSITNAGQLLDRLARLACHGRQVGHRSLLALTLAVPDCDELVADIKALCATISGSADHTRDLRDRQDRISDRLGTETSLQLIDTRHILDPSAIAAAAGTLRAGGVLVLLLPAIPGNGARYASSRFRTRLRNCLHRHSRHSSLIELIRVDSLGRSGDTGSSPRSGLGHYDTDTVPLEAGDSDRPPLPAIRYDRPMTPEGLQQQNDALRRIVRTLRQDPSVAILIIGRRGAGKSALLGQLAARFDIEGRRWLSTSTRRGAVQSLELHWRRASHEAAHPESTSEEASEPNSRATASSPGTGHGEVTPPHETRFPWKSIDACLASTGDCLLIDEAADVPLARLVELSRRYTTVVLASTSSGYEAAGRGYRLRLPELLETAGRACLSLSMRIPMRWRQHDPLEAVLNDALLLDTAVDEAMPAATVLNADLSVNAIPQSRLIDDEPLLRMLYGLLRESHYRHTPRDLVHLLDAEGLELLALATPTDTPVAVLLLAYEGPLDADCHDQVLAGRRRPADQLLPTRLALCCDAPEPLALRYARVVRIAVHADHRRQGLGSRLLRAAVALNRSRVQAVGASYSQSATADAFWRANGFHCIHEGFRPRAHSGRPSRTVLRAMASGQAVSPWIDVARYLTLDNRNPTPLTRIRQSLEGCRTDESGQTSPHSMHTTTTHLVVPTGVPSDRQLLERFIAGARSRHDTRGPLFRLWHSMAVDTNASTSIEEALPGWERHLERAAGASADASRRRCDQLCRRWARENLTP